MALEKPGCACWVDDGYDEFQRGRSLLAPEYILLGVVIGIAFLL